MPTIAITCRSCGNEFQPSGDDIRAGHWHTCPRCRGEPGEQASGDQEADPTRDHGQPAARNGREGDT